MLTRCPACQTAFRISNAQLQARRGLVRCGHCQTPFDARQHLIETEVPIPGKHSAPAPNTPPNTSEADSAAKAHLENTSDFFFTASSPSSPKQDKNSPAASPSDFWSVDAPSPPAQTRRESSPIEGSTPSQTESDQVETLNDSVDFWLPPLPDEPTPATTNFAEQLNKAERERQTPPPSASPTTSIPAAPPAALANQTAAQDEPAAPSPDFLSRSAKSANKKPTHFAWAVGAGALGLTLLAQGLLLSRHEIAMRWPSLRPALVHLCVSLHCDLPLPRKKEQIVLEGSDLHPQPTQKARYRLEAQIRNRAPHVQAYPYLELTLTDARDRPIARRVFPPEEWASGQTTEIGIASQQRVDVALDIETRDLQAIGYRLYVFYP